MSFHIKPDALVGLLEQYKGKTFCHLETVTVPKLLQKGRDSKQRLEEKLNLSAERIRKFSSFSAGIGYNYAHIIEGRLIRAGKSPEEYERGESWHEPYNGSSVIRRHKKTGELYVCLSLIANNPAKAEYKVDDKVVDTRELKEYLPLEYEAKNQGLEEEDQVKFITLKLASITKLVAEKAEYIVG
jgi:hypothetical protein